MFQYNFEKTIVDSGTTNFRLPVKVYKSVIKQLKEASKVSISLVNLSSVGNIVMKRFCFAFASRSTYLTVIHLIAQRCSCIVWLLTWHLLSGILPGHGQSLIFHRSNENMYIEYVYILISRKMTLRLWPSHLLLKIKLFYMTEIRCVIVKHWIMTLPPKTFL